MAMAADTAFSSECTVWAAPHAGPPRPSLFSRAGSSENPIRIEDFWPRAKPGDTLCLKDGVYTGATSMIRPPAGLSGTPGAPITIRAENDGAVLIDGGSRAGSKIKGPVRLKNNDYFVLEGFDAANSNSVVLAIGGSWDKEEAKVQLTRSGWDPIEHVTIRRVVAWNANPRFSEYHECEADPGCTIDRRKGWSANFHVVDVSAAKDVLLEDVAAFGTGRKVFQVYLSENVTIRRAWGRWEGNATTHAQTFSCAYRSYGSLCENVIGTWSAQQQDQSIDIRGQLKTVLGMDWFKASDRWQQPADPFDSGLRVLGSLAYVKRDVTLPPENVVVFGYGKNQVLRDIVAYSGNQDPGLHTVNLTGCLPRVKCSWTAGRGPEEAPLRASAITAIGGDGRVVVGRDWSRVPGFVAPTNHPSLEASRPNVFAADGTEANLCHRYVDGKRTEEPLWPWPMNDRILAATGSAHAEATDVQAEVEALLGEIPAACKAVASPVE
jgi:hypothetical protein